MRNKLYLGLGAFAAIAAAITLNAIAQDTLERPVTDQQQTELQRTNEFQTTETTEYDRDQTAAGQATQHHGHKASELIGLNVRGYSGDDDIGEINDLMIGKDGKVIYAAVSFGGFLGLGDKLFAVPFEAIELVKVDDDTYARMDVSEETLKDMEGFNQDNWPEQPNHKFRRGLGRQAERSDTDVDVDVSR
jgi:hypothetical protein